VVGRDQAAEHSSSYSKTAAKMARYADTFDKQASDFICNRCKALKRNDVWAAYDALRDVEPGVFMAQLKSIVQRRRFALCIYVLDATDPEFTAVNSLRNAIGSVPVILVVNKVDLVPRMSNYDLNAILHRLKMSKNVAGLFATSASTGAGVVELAECILGQLKGRDVFVVGSANVGKSSLVKALAPTIADCVRMKGKAYSKRRDMAHNLNVTGSHLPGTTLQALRIPCFATLGNALWDTPGIINTSALGYSLFPSHLMDPLNIPTPLVVPDNYSEEGRTRICYMNEGQSLLVEATWMGDDENCCFARLDMTNGGEIECRAYLPPSLRLRVVPTKDAPREARIPINYVRERKASVEKSARGNSGLADEYARPLVPFQDATTGAKEWDKTGRRYAMDITLASLGWISFLDSIPFTLVPMVVEGSKWGKRKSLYPRNLNGWLEANGTPEHEVTELTDARKRDISDTIRMAKKNQYGGKNPDFSDDDDDWEGYDGDEFDDSWAR
jgi:GTP-binding protein EngB required for normal cell division